MPANLRFYNRDPNGLGRGRGVYYHRGHGYWSKYDVGRDAKIQARGCRTHKTGLSKTTGKASKIAQAGDGKLPR